MQHSVLLSLFILWMGFEVAVCFTGARCTDDCTQVTCGRNKTFKKFCKAGTVYDICGCCQVCGKAEGEHCDNINGFFGRCGRRLYCKIKPGHLIGQCTVNRIAEKITTKRDLRSLGQLHNYIDGNCHPKCSPDFCTKYPYSVCSAVDNAIISRTCQTPCQHTVCGACYYKLKREPPCPKCASDDFQCFQKFAKCVRRETCTKQKFPCQSYYQKRKGDGRFVCKVAACFS